ncbi:hypothetical protein C8R46DRAFT_1039775 [Mycena filopes]|nr:hypothetical protein C8R46DRAFT_1039775 [Mycena filopes]
MDDASQAPNPSNNDADSEKVSVKWIGAEVMAMLDELAELKTIRGMMSGNGFKPQVWPKVVPKVQNANPDVDQKKTKTQCMNKLNYLKKIFVHYVFVRKFSGTGWNDKDHHATNTEEYIEGFLTTHGKEYARCFTTPCPYWTQLDSLFDGLNNRATGENVTHLGTASKKSRKRKSASVAPPTASSSRNPLQPIPSATTNQIPVDPALIEDDDITLIDPDAGAAGAQPFDNDVVGAGRFDDELGLLPPTPKGKRRERADTDDEDENSAVATERPKSKRQRSESGGAARRNAEAGTQISRALDNFATVMAQPLVTSEDLSHVKEIVSILKDKTLLPDDPRGKLYRTVSKVLTQDAAQAHLFILEDDRTRRIALLEGILEDAGLMPEN